MKFYTVARQFVKFLSYVFFPVNVIGDTGDIPQQTGVVLCANHLSYLDAVFLGIAFKRQIRFVAKEKYANMPVLKSIFKWLGAFGIDPTKSDLAAIKNCFKVIRSGEVLGIFPEGTRIIKGRVSTPMSGAVMIAHKTKAPIFYVRIRPKHGHYRLFSKTDVIVGNTVSVEELGVTNGKGEQYKDASAVLMKKIYSLGEE